MVQMADLQRNPSVPRSILSSMTSRMLTPVHGLLRFGLFAKSPSGDLHLVQLSGPQTLFTQLLAGEAKNDHDNFATLSSVSCLEISALILDNLGSVGSFSSWASVQYCPHQPQSSSLLAIHAAFLLCPRSSRGCPASQVASTGANLVHVKI